MSLVTYLINFNVKAKKLLNLTFSKDLEKAEFQYSKCNFVLVVKINKHFEDSGIIARCGEAVTPSVKEVGPSGEQFDSYILNMRLCIQNNDLYSIQNLNKQYTQNCNNEILKQSFYTLKDSINLSLDSNIIAYKRISNGEYSSLTSRQIIDSYVYGEYAHSNPEKKQLFDEMKFGENHNWSFYISIQKFNEFIKQIVELNEKVIATANKS